MLVLTFIGLMSFGLVNDVSAQYITIGTGTSTSTPTWGTGTGISPFGTYYHDDRTQMLYLASELTTAGASGGNILSIGFDVANVAAAMNGFTIKVKNTSTSSLTAYETGLTTVYTSGSQTLTVGWNDFTLPVPFNWNGTDNIVVEVCFDNAAYTSNSTVKYSSTTFTSTRSSYCDSCAPGCSNTTSFQNTYSSRTNTRFKFAPPVANNAGIVKIDTPYAPSCVLDTSLYVRVRNSGTDTLNNVTVNWTVNGAAKPAANWTGTLAPNTTDSVPFYVGIHNFTDNDTVVVWTSMPNNVVDSSSIDDTLTQVLHSALSGTLTISKNAATNPDYSSFTAAVNALEMYGVCGPVIFNVDDTTYTEQIKLKEFMGMSSTNTVTFQSASGNNTGVKLSYSASTSSGNYTVHFDGGDHFTFKNITIQNLGSSNSVALRFNNKASHNKIEGCVVESPTSTSSWNQNRAVIHASGVENDSNSFVGNTINGGTYGIYYNGNFNNYNKGLKIEKNKMNNQYHYGMYVYYQKDPVINENHLKTDNAYNFGYGIYCVNVVESKVINNYVDEGTGNNPAFNYGMYFSSSNGSLGNWTVITGNRIKFRTYGIYVTNGVFNVIANNTVFATNATTSSGSRAFFITGGSTNQVLNNNFHNGAGGYAYYVSGNPIYKSDNNNLYSSGTNQFYSGGNITTLAAFVSATNTDSSSISVVNAVQDTMMLRACNDSLDGKGQANSFIVDDFQGDMRSASNPDIGADEFAAISSFSLGNDKVLCNGDTINMIVNYFDTVIWGTGDTTKTLTVTSPASYTVKAMNVCGVAHDTIVVLAQKMPQLNNTLNLCAGDSAVLNPDIPNGTYNWSNGDTSSTITVNSVGTYKVTIVDAFGCNSNDSTTVTQSTAVSLPDSVRFCEGNNATLDAVIAGTYLWSDAGSTTTQTLTVTASGDYSVTVTDAHNCVSKDTTNVTKVLNPVAAFVDSATYYTVSLTNNSANGTSYAWDFGDGTSSNQQNPGAHVYPYWPTAKEYTIKLVVTNECGSDSTTKKVTVGPTSVEDVTANTIISLYPNPAQDVFVLGMSTSENVDASLQVVNISGQEVINQTIGKVTGESKTTVDISALSKGVYFVNVTLNGKQMVYKLVKN